MAISIKVNFTKERYKLKIGPFITWLDDESFYNMFWNGLFVTQGVYRKATPEEIRKGSSLIQITMIKHVHAIKASLYIRHLVKKTDKLPGANVNSGSISLETSLARKHAELFMSHVDIPSGAYDIDSVVYLKRLN